MYRNDIGFKDYNFFSRLLSRIHIRSDSILCPNLPSNLKSANGTLIVSIVQMSLIEGKLHRN